MTVLQVFDKGNIYLRFELWIFSYNFIGNTPTQDIDIHVF